MKILDLFKDKNNPAQKQADKLQEFHFTEFSENGINFSDFLNKQHKEKTQAAYQQGKILGSLNQPLSESTKSNGVELEVQTFYQSLVHKLQKITLETISDLKITYAKQKADVEEFAKRIEEKISTESEKIKTASDIATKKVEAIFAQRNEHCKEKLSELSSTVKTEKQVLRGLEVQLEPEHEDKPARSRKKVLYSILGLIAVLELAMTNRTVLAMREDIISTFLLAILFSLIIPISAHFFGTFLKKKQISKKEVFLMVTAFLIALLFSGIVGYIRYQYLHERNIFVLSSWGFAAINFILFLVGSFVSYHLSFKNPELVLSLFSHKEALASAETEQEEVQKQQNNLESEEASSLQDIADKYPAYAKARAETQLASMKNQLLAKGKEYNAVLSAAKNQEHLICSYFAETLSVFRSENEKWRNTPTPAYWSNAKLTLETFFSGEGILEPHLSADDTESSIAV